jgi:HSP20 family molecular chaperone IbpA
MTAARDDNRQSQQAAEAACGTDEPGQFEVKEEGREIVLWAELPGYVEGELDVQVQDGELSVRAGPFFHKVRVPPGTTPGQVRATFINGVLELRVPKA